jgi:hypothetical protein
MCDNRVQGGFESVGAALGLGEEQSALQSGEQCKGEPARVGLALQGAVIDQTATCRTFSPWHR